MLLGLLGKSELWACQCLVAQAFGAGECGMTSTAYFWAAECGDEDGETASWHHKRRPQAPNGPFASTSIVAGAEGLWLCCL